MTEGRSRRAAVRRGGQRQEISQAVSLKYEPEHGSAPRITAKGKGKLALKMLELARTEGVPIKEDPDLVGALSQLDWYQEIPPALYRAVAEVLAFAYRLNRLAEEEIASR